MNPRRQLRVMFAIAALLSVCSCGSTSPVSPSPSSPAPAVIEPATGQIVVKSITASGSRLSVAPCWPPPVEQEYLCTDDWSATFEVVFSQDVHDPILTVSFDRCVDGAVENAPIRAGETVTLSLRRVAMSGDEITPRFCTLPVTTNGLRLQLWERTNPRTPLLTKEVAYSYTFDNK